MNLHFYSWSHFTHTLLPTTQSNLNIKPPGKIRKISRILLKITENDIIDKKPIRSAVIVSKINKMNGNNIPHEDFFLFLSKNKIYNGEKNIKSYTQFHKKLIKELFS